MKIFVSWSKDRSKDVALALKDWLPQVIQTAEVWVSDVDIRKGDLWMSEITDSLAATDVGIVVLTQENLSEQWLNFEAGALSRALGKPRVVTLLVGLEHAEVSGPLANFNGTKAEQADIVQMVRDICPAELSVEVVARAAEMYWPTLQAAIDGVVGQGVPAGSPPVATEKEMIAEILETVRDLRRPAASLNLTARRQRPSSNEARALHRALVEGAIKPNAIRFNDEVGTLDLVYDRSQVPTKYELSRAMRDAGVDRVQVMAADDNDLNVVFSVGV